MASKAASRSVSCSVCLEQVTDAGERSIAKLKCGHHFHLDCIGSAFNAKGSMQCPNCRHVEDGRWLYASGCRPQLDDFSLFEDTPLSLDDDEYEVYTGIAEVHPHAQVSWQWCPYPQFSLTFEELEHPTPEPPDGDVIFHYVGERAAGSVNGLRGRCPVLELQQHARHIEEQLQQQFEEQVVVQSQIETPGSGGGGGGGVLPGGNMMRGPQAFPVERTGHWLSQHLPPATTSAVGMMNDVGLSSLPIDRFRWSAQANRSEPGQPRFSGPPETSPTSWHSPPCPQHGPQHGFAASGISQGSSARRSRYRAHGANSSSSSGGGGGSRLGGEVSRGSRHQQQQGHGGAAAASGNVWQQQMGGFEAMPEYSGHHPYSWLLDSAPSYHPFGHSYEPDYIYTGQPSINPFASRGYYQQPRH